MDKENQARQTMGILFGAILIAGLLASVAFREVGGSPVTAGIVAGVLNLAGAVVVDWVYGWRGAVTGAMLVMLVGLFLPLLWVSNPGAWLRENPPLGGILVLLAASLRHRYQVTWPLYIVALLMGGAYVLISLI